MAYKGKSPFSKGPKASAPPAPEERRPTYHEAVADQPTSKKVNKVLEKHRIAVANSHPSVHHHHHRTVVVRSRPSVREMVLNRLAQRPRVIYITKRSKKPKGKRKKKKKKGKKASKVKKAKKGKSRSKRRTLRRGVVRRGLRGGKFYVRVSKATGKRYKIYV